MGARTRPAKRTPKGSLNNSCDDIVVQSQTKSSEALVLFWCHKGEREGNKGQDAKYHDTL